MNKHTSFDEGHFNILDIFFFLFVTSISTFIILNGKFINILSGDSGDAYFALLVGITRSIVSRELPLWSPNLWGGYYAAAFPYTGVFYPITILINLLCYDTVTNTLSYMVLPINLIVHTVIMTVSLYGFFRILRLKQMTCVISAVFAITPGYFLGFWYAFILSASWIPCIILFSVLAFRESTRKAYLYCIAAGFSFGLSGLAMPVQTLLINILVFVFLVLFFIWENKKNKKTIASLYTKAFVIGLLGFSICSVSLLPFIELYNNSLRFVPDYGFITPGQKINFLDFIKHSVLNSEIRGIFGGGGRFDIGLATSIFLFCNFFLKRTNNKVIYHFALFAFIFCLCYSLGFVFPDFFYYIPFFNAIRQPLLYTRYVCISAAILAALGLDPFLRDSRKKMSGDKFHHIFGFLCIIVGSLLFSLLPHNRKYFSNVLVTISLAVFFVLFIPGKMDKLRKKIAPVVLVISIFGSLYSFWISFDKYKLSASAATSKIESVNSQTKRLIDFLNEKNGHPYYRICRFGNVMPSNSASVLNAYDVFAYLNPMYTKSVKIHSMDLTNRAKIQNIKYALVGSNMDDAFRDWFEIAYPEFIKINTMDNYADYDAEEMSAVTVYENTNYIGPAWLVYDFQTYNSTDEFEKIYEMISNSSKDLSNTVFINNATLARNLTNRQIQHYPQNARASVKILSYKTNSICYEVNTKTQGILVSAECYYPGWKVYVNGKREQLMEANYWGRAAIVPEGRSTVEFKFMPLSFIIGCLLIFTSIFFCILYFLYYLKGGKNG